MKFGSPWVLLRHVPPGMQPCPMVDAGKLLLTEKLQHALQHPHSNTRGTVTSESPARQQGKLKATLNTQQHAQAYRHRGSNPHKPEMKPCSLPCEHQATTRHISGTAKRRKCWPLQAYAAQDQAAPGSPRAEGKLGTPWCHLEISASTPHLLRKWGSERRLGRPGSRQKLRRARLQQSTRRRAAARACLSATPAPPQPRSRLTPSSLQPRSPSRAAAHRAPAGTILASK